MRENPAASELETRKHILGVWAAISRRLGIDVPDSPAMRGG
jgi:hypothetical protein